MTDTIEDICKTIGQPINQTDVSIQSIEKKIILPIGSVGEICARGPSKMLRYYNNPAVEASGLSDTQKLATLLDGISRHTPEGHNFKKRVEEKGWKQAVDERDKGTFDWTNNSSFTDR